MSKLKVNDRVRWFKGGDSRGNLIFLTGVVIEISNRIKVRGDDGKITTFDLREMSIKKI